MYYILAIIYINIIDNIYVRIIIYIDIFEDVTVMTLSLAEKSRLGKQS